MELTVEARVMHSVGPVASPLNCRAQVSRKRKASDRALPVRGFLQNRLEEEYGYHDTSDNHRCAAVAQRRLVWPRALVLVSLSTISARSSHWGSVMMGPGSELHLPLKPSAQFGKAARGCSSPSAELEAMPLSSIHPNAVERGFDRSAIDTLTQSTH